MTKSVDKLQSLAKQAKRIHQELNDIQKEQENYQGGVLVYKTKGGSFKNIGLIVQIDFIQGYFKVKVFGHDREQMVYMSTIDYEVISREELIERL